MRWARVTAVLFICCPPIGSVPDLARIDQGLINRNVHITVPNIAIEISPSFEDGDAEGMSQDDLAYEAKAAAI